MVYKNWPPDRQYLFRDASFEICQSYADRFRRSSGQREVVNSTRIGERDRSHVATDRFRRIDDPRIGSRFRINRRRKLSHVFNSDEREDRMSRIVDP